MHHSKAHKFRQSISTALIKSTLKRCDAATIRFAIDELYLWSPERFWTKKHERLVALNLQLPRGAGLIPQHQLCDSAYVASWLQPLTSMASAFGVSKKSLLREWSASTSSSALLEMKACLSKLGFESLRSAQKCFSKARQKHKDLMEKKKEQGDLPRHWEFKFHWQKFLSKGVWQRRTEEYISAVASSDLPEVIKDIEAERFKARLDSFARRIHNVTPWEPRLKLTEQDFLDSRSFFFGVPLVPPYEVHDGQRTEVPTAVKCGIVNLNDQYCGRCSDCCGHHAFVCPCTSKQIEHNAMRDALNHAAKAMSFLSSKEVTVPAWRKRPDNELVDPTGQEATAWVDVSIRALVQEKMLPLKQIVQYAVQEKRGMFPLKNSQGHRVVSGDFVPFVMTNMGSLDKAAHQFLRKLRKKSRQRTDHLMDVLVVQHAKWIARRLQRSLGHFNKPASERPSRPRKQFSTAKQPSRGRLQTLHDGIRNPTAKRRGRPPKTRPATGGASSVVFGDDLSQAFEEEMETDADANSRLMLLPESQLKRSGNDPLQSEDDFITHPDIAAVLNVAKPVAQLDAHPVSSTTK